VQNREAKLLKLYPYFKKVGSRQKKDLALNKKRSVGTENLAMVYMYSIQYTVYSIQYTVYSIQYRTVLDLTDQSETTIEAVLRISAILVWIRGEPDPYLILMDPDPGGPKTYGSCGSGSTTLNRRSAITLDL
jgi:hypothetical protein